jgi:hypothetical protein
MQTKIPIICLIISVSNVFLLFSMSATSYAIDIIFKNRTSVPLKIVWFMDSCDNVILNAKNQFYLKPNEKTCFVDLQPVMHHYKICANGTCQTTALGVNLSNDLYIVEAILKGKQVRSICTPNIWPGITSCGKIFLSNANRFHRN